MKKIKLHKKIQQYRDLKILRNVIAAFENKDYQAAINLCKTVVFCDEEKITKQNRDFFYYKAAAMDATHDSVGALEIFRRLLVLYPSNPVYLNSFQVARRSLNIKAFDAYLKDPLDPILIKYYELFCGMGQIPYYLHVAHARELIRGGHTTNAKQKMLNLLSLSPGDPDFIECNLNLACEAGDEVWFAQVQKGLKKILKKYPSRFDLYPLVAEG